MRLIFVSHPEVLVEPDTPVTSWSLSEKGAARAETFARSDVLQNTTKFVASAETKARETAEILSSGRDVSMSIDARLGENDRSSTGFLTPDVFEHAADFFFASPEASFKGWERAVDAQSRIVSACTDIAGSHGAGDLAIVSHGAVGTLLWCHLSGRAISRAYDQPSQGHYWTAPLPLALPHCGWTSIG